MVPLERCGRLPRAVRDVGDANFQGDGGVERGDAQNLPPSGVGEMPRPRKEGMGSIKVNCIVLEGYYITRGGGAYTLMCWVDLDVGVLGLPNGVRLHEAQKIVHTTRGGEEAHPTHRGHILTQCPPQVCGASLPPKVGVAGGGAEVTMHDMGGGVRGMQPRQPPPLHQACPCRMWPFP